MSMRYQAGYLTTSHYPLLAPDAPTIGTATAGNAQATVTFTAPSNTGAGAITGYVVVSSGGQTASGSASPITVTGLTIGVAYTFRVYAVSAYGTSPFSAVSNSVTPVAQGQQAYTTSGTYSWVAPSGVTSVSVVAVGGGGGSGNQTASSRQASGAGGGLGYKNNITVVPGNSYTVVVGAEGQIGSPGTAGGDSYFINTSTVKGGGGGGGSQNTRPSGGTYTGDGGGNGGAGALSANSWGQGGTINDGWHCGAGGGGAGGYSGAGGAGGDAASSPGSSGGQNGAAGSGGGAGGGAGGGGQWGSGGAGGGVGLLGQGASGGASTPGNARAGQGGSGGTNATGSTSSDGSTAGNYGGGQAGAPYPFGSAGGGAVRIIWPGDTRSFPSTNTGDL